MVRSTNCLGKPHDSRGDTTYIQRRPVSRLLPMSPRISIEQWRSSARPLACAVLPPSTISQLTSRAGSSIWRCSSVPHHCGAKISNELFAVPTIEEIFMQATAPIPDHVPRDLVRDFNFFTIAAVDGDIHLGWKKLHEGPDIFWTPHNGGHWVATRADDLEEMYK